MKYPTRRTIFKLAAAATATTALAPFAALAQGTQWPSKPVSLLVGYPPGGLTDAGARFISRGMATTLAQPVVIDNKPGAGGNIAATEVQRANDPYKLLVANTSFTMPSTPPEMAARLLVAKLARPTAYGMPRAVASSSVRPTIAASGME